MPLSIQQVAKASGTTSRTLRHYDAIGLLTPSRTDTGGRRWYDDDALVRLQQILLLRGLGLPLGQIGQVLDDQVDELGALRGHLGRLQAEQGRLARQAAAVERTITARARGAQMDTETMFDGFDHTQYEDEVTQRWGAHAHATSDAWWRAMSPEERRTWKARAAALVVDWRTTADSGVGPGSPAAQELAARHVAWLGSVPGTPQTAGGPAPQYVLGLADMYAADERFAATYGGVERAGFVREALHQYVEKPHTDRR
ncbi:MAG: MerR family transcriptional regulator [Cellulomonas sp.]|nr:MerR family transcriptional regulator [Cellulomonas sp.]